MAIQLKSGYACSICGTKYNDDIQADKCRDSHEMLYIPFSKTELNRLINGLMLEDLSLIPESVFNTLRKYAREASIKQGR